MPFDEAAGRRLATPVDNYSGKTILFLIELISHKDTKTQRKNKKLGVFVS
jgi:hypothetical protein